MFHKSLPGRASAALLSCALFIGCATTSNPSAQLYEAERAYRDAGADCVFAPGVVDTRQLRELGLTIDKPQE